LQSLLLNLLLLELLLLALLQNLLLEKLQFLLLLQTVHLLLKLQSLLILQLLLQQVVVKLMLHMLGMEASVLTRRTAHQWLLLVLLLLVLVVVVLLLQQLVIKLMLPNILIAHLERLVWRVLQGMTIQSGWRLHPWLCIPCKPVVCLAWRFCLHWRLTCFRPEPFEANLAPTACRKQGRQGVCCLAVLKGQPKAVAIPRRCFAALR